MGRAGKRKADEPAISVSAEDMAIMRQVMEKNWTVLRALALGDEYPDLDTSTLLKMAEEQNARRQSKA